MASFSEGRSATTLDPNDSLPDADYLDAILGPDLGKAEIEAALVGDVSLHTRVLVSAQVVVEEMSLQDASLHGTFFETQAQPELDYGGAAAQDSFVGVEETIMEETEAEGDGLEVDQLEESLEPVKNATEEVVELTNGVANTTGMRLESDDPYLSKLASQTSDHNDPFSGMPPPPVEDSSAFPSSSASVAERLLSPRRRPSAAASPVRNGNGIAPTHAEPQSSADPDISNSALLSGPRSSSSNNPPFVASGNPFGGSISADNSFSGPTTSTPAGIFSAPHPLTAARTVPTIGLLPMQERLDSTPHTVSSPPAPKSLGFYQSSTAAKAIPPPQREKPIARQWYDEEDEYSPEGASPGRELEETMNVDDGEKDMTISESQAAPRQAIEQPTADVEASEHATSDDKVDVVPPASEGREESTEPHPSSDQPFPAPRQISLDPSTSTSDAPAPAQPRQVASDPSQPSTSHQSSILKHALAELTAIDNSDGPMSLTGIGDLQSSMEIPPNYVPEMTQTSPSAETLQHIASSRSPSPVDSEKEEDEIAPIFDVDEASGSARQHTNPRPGRELRRNPPPVTSDPEARPSSPPKDSPASTVVDPASPTNIATSPVPEELLVTATVTVVEKRVQAIIQLPDSTAKSLPASSLISESNGYPTPAAALSTPPNASPRVDQSAAVEKDLVEGSNQAEPSEAERAPSATESLSPAQEASPKPQPVAQPKKKAKSKGKGRARPRETSPDALDLFLKSQKNPVQEVEQVEESFIGEAAHLEETNYDELPTPQNVRKSSARPRGGIGHGDSSSPSASASVPPRNKRQRLSEPVVEIEMPRQRRASVSPSKKKANKNPRAASLPSRARSARPQQSLREPSTSSELSDLEVMKPAATKGKGKRSRGSGSTEENIPVSKRARTSIKAGAADANSMPFTRVFALWRDDHYLYPGTITEVVGRSCKILFDDDSEATVKFHDLRRCELKQGDMVRYRGDEVDAETQALEGDLMVLRVERGPEGKDYFGELAQDDTVVGTKVVADFAEQEKLKKKERLAVAAICIQPEFTKKLDDRMLTEDEIAQLSGLDPTAVLRSVPVKSVKVVRNPPANATAANLFAGFGFIVTRVVYDKPASADASTSSEKITTMSEREIELEKVAFDRRLVKNGATIIDVDDLFTVDTHDPSHLVAKFASTKFAKLHTILLLADRPSTTPKYMVALALGIPCVSRLFIQASEDAGKKIEWNQFVITAGYSQALGTHAIGGQMKALSGSKFDLASFAQHHPGTALFHESTFLIVLSKKGKSTDRDAQMATLRRILVAAGAQQVDFVLTPAEARSGAEYDFVFLEDKQKLPVALESHRGIANIEWMKQCLINGRVLEAERMNAVES